MSRKPRLKSPRRDVSILVSVGQLAYSVLHPAALKGRFIHITDFHPDPHYKTGATFESGCHARPKKDHKDKGKGKGKEADSAWEHEDDVKGVESVKKGQSDFAGRWGSGIS